MKNLSEKDLEAVEGNLDSLRRKIYDEIEKFLKLHYPAKKDLSIPLNAIRNALMGADELTIMSIYDEVANL